MTSQHAFAFVPTDQPNKPRQIVTETSAQFFDLCDRDRAGLLVIESVKVGRTPAEWVCDVRWK